MNKIIRINTNTLRTLSSPYKGNEDESALSVIYFMLVNIKNLPSDIPTDVYPYDINMETNVARKLVDSILEPETDFHINNQGIVISAKSLYFDSNNSVAVIDLGNLDDESDRYSYGILDGAHTYNAIINNRNKIPENIDKYIRIEVITNVPNISRLSDARNTKLQEDELVNLNLEGCFQNITNAIKNEPFANNIAYNNRENKQINVVELIQLMYAFDIIKYPDDKIAPIKCYTNKNQVLQYYKEIYKTPYYQALSQQIPKIIELYECIEADIPKNYCEYKRCEGTFNLKPESIRGVSYIKESFKTKFWGNDIKYMISEGYIYPIIGAFRSLMNYDENKNEITWTYDPIDIWNEIGIDLVQNTLETNKNPQLAGMNQQLWLSNYRLVEAHTLKKLINKK